MSDEKKKMTEEELAKAWEEMADSADGGSSGESNAIDSNTDSMGLSDSLKERNQTTGSQPNIDFLLDIPLTISAELGRSKMIVYDLLQLSQGSVLELNKLAGEPLDVRVNNKLIARGEAVVVNEKFGVRITDIVNPQERIENLKGD